MTPTSALLALAGLSQADAADYLGIRVDTVKSWARSRNPTTPRPGVTAELLELIHGQEAAADQVLADAARRGLTEIVITAPADDAEARALGYPGVSAWGAMLARVIAGASVPVVLLTFAAKAPLSR